MALPTSLVHRLRGRLAGMGNQDRAGVHEQAWQRPGVRQPSPPASQADVEEVNAPWAGFHTFRHTFASLHLSRGTNLLQLSRALGHLSAAFTLSRYTHLLPGDEAPALDLDLVAQSAMGAEGPGGEGGVSETLTRRPARGVAVRSMTQGVVRGDA